LGQRAPLAQLAIISMVGAAAIQKVDLSSHLKKANYLLVVPQPPKPQPQQKKETKPMEKVKMGEGK
jgi:hypothetical protein